MMVIDDYTASFSPPLFLKNLINIIFILLYGVDVWLFVYAVDVALSLLFSISLSPFLKQTTFSLFLLFLLILIFRL